MSTKFELDPQPAVAQISLLPVLRALSDHVRLEVVAILAAEGEQTCGPLAARLSLPQPTLSHHLRQLRESGLTQSRRDGTLRWMSLRAADVEAALPGLLSSVLAAIGAPATSAGTR